MSVMAGFQKLGTLIASMASLITYKLAACLLYFTVANVCFLAVLVILYVCSTQYR